MQENIDTEQKQLKPKGDELVLPIVALLFAFYYLYTIKDLAWEAQINGVLIGSVLIGLILIFLIRTGLEVRRQEASLKFNDLFRWGRVQAGRLGLFGLAVAYVLVIPYAGYTLTTLVFLAMAMFVLGVRSPAKLLAIPLVLSLTGYYLFIALLDTRFPPGPVEKLIETLF
jgi:hypothetical protein